MFPLSLSLSLSISISYNTHRKNSSHSCNLFPVFLYSYYFLFIDVLSFFSCTRPRCCNPLHPSNNWNSFSETFKIPRIKQIYVEQRAQVEILSIKRYPKFQMTRIWQISTIGEHYCQQRLAETDVKCWQKKIWKALSNIFCRRWTHDYVLQKEKLLY